MSFGIVSNDEKWEFCLGEYSVENESFGMVSSIGKWDFFFIVSSIK